MLLELQVAFAPQIRKKRTKIEKNRKIGENERKTGKTARKKGKLSVMWVKPSGQTLLPLYLLSSLLLTSTQVVQLQLYELHLYSSSCLRPSSDNDKRLHNAAWLKCSLPRQKRALPETSVGLGRRFSGNHGEEILPLLPLDLDQEF